MMAALVVKLVELKALRIGQFLWPSAALFLLPFFCCTSVFASEIPYERLRSESNCSPFQLIAALGHQSAQSEPMRALGSISKLVTATVAIKLLNSHGIALDSPIGLPQLNGRALALPISPAVTWRQLLRHERGLFNYSESPQFQQQPLLPPDAAFTYALSMPGYDSWHYSNSNYLLAGLLLQNIGQQTWPQLVHRQVLAPIGIEQSAWRYPESTTVPSADMGLSLRASDALRFICALFDGQLLDKEQRRELLNFVWLNDNYAYGLGLARKQLQGQTIYFHVGATEAVHTGLYYLPAQKRALLLWQPRLADGEKAFQKWETDSLQAMLPLR